MDFGLIIFGDIRKSPCYNFILQRETFKVKRMRLASKRGGKSRGKMAYMRCCRGDAEGERGQKPCLGGGAEVKKSGFYL